MPPPLLVYDDDCGFCTWGVEWALEHGAFEAVGFSAVTEEQRARLPDDYEVCVHLLTDDAVYSCGEAVEQVLARTGAAGWWSVAALRGVPGYPSARERLYQVVADNRSLFGRLVRSRER